MLLRLLGSRGFMSIAGAVVLVAVAAAGYVLAFDPFKKTVGYCALMPDTIGLYVGSHVTMRGMPIGEVTSITPTGTSVRVEFTVEAAHPVLVNAAATTVSDTLVADRELSIINADKATQPWTASTCISRTLTPKSMTETLGALADLSKEALGSDDDGQDTVGRGLRDLNAATAGTGPQLNAIVHKLATAMDSPDAALGHLAGLIASLSSLSTSVAGHWGDIKSMLLGLSSVLDQVNNELFGRTVEIIDGFQKVLPMLNDITTLFGDPIFKVLDATVPLVKLLHDNAESLRDIVTKVPVLTSAYRAGAGPDSAGIGLVLAATGGQS